MKFKTTPYAHQLACHNQFSADTYAGYLCEMGCGKSKILVDTIARLYLEGRIDGVVVLAPKGCYQDWKDSHVPDHMPTEVKYRLVEWRAAPGVSLMANLRSIAKATPSVLHILVLNVEAVIGVLPQKILNYFLDHHKALFAVDEATTIGNPTARRTKIIVKLGPKAAYRRILTGDLAPNSPLTIYAPCDFLSPGCLGHQSFYSFKGAYAQQITQRGAGGRQFQQVVGFRNLDELTERMKRFCFIVKKADCLDLPEKIYHTRSIEMGPKQAAAYKQMLEEAMVTLEMSFHEAEYSHNPGNMDDYFAALEEDPAFETRFHGTGIEPESNPSKMSTANLVIVQLLRLHQIACGYLTTDDGVETGFDEPNARLEALLEILDQCERGAIIWACYRFNIKQIADAIAARFGPDTVTTFFGDTTPEERRERKKWFQETKGRHFFVVNQASGKYGMTLTAADTAVYYANTYDREARAQSEDRNHRIGQTHACNIIDIVAKMPGGAATVDGKIIKVLKGKEALSESLRPSSWRELFDEAA